MLAYLPFVVLLLQSPCSLATQQRELEPTLAVIGSSEGPDPPVQDESQFDGSHVDITGKRRGTNETVDSGKKKMQMPERKLSEGELKGIGTFEDSISFESDAEPYLPTKPSVDDKSVEEKS
mmetsp:Transcript_8601/g.15894  ORF Transcript_8601/g.15894 Transcript_8601/m.15894 type:complete len:121 (-) Transcript_8601:61-423(-)